MTILLIYATNSGSTYSVAKIIQNLLEKKGHQVVTKKVVETHPDELHPYNLVILGSPSWDYDGKEGMPHETMVEFMKKTTGYNYNGKLFTIFGCGDKAYTYFCGAVDHLENFVKENNGNQIVESLKIDGFFFNEEKNSKKVEDWAKHLISKLEN